MIVYKTGKYLLVSRDLYWMPNGQGYTGVKERAGRYSKSEARPDCGVTAIHEDEAPEYSAACYEDVKAAHLQSKVDFLTARVAELEASQ